MTQQAADSPCPQEKMDILTSLSSTHLLFHPFVPPSFKCHYINLQQGGSGFPESNSNPTAYKHTIFREDLSYTPISESIFQARTKAWKSYYLSTLRKYWPRFLLLPCLVEMSLCCSYQRIADFSHVLPTFLCPEYC